MLLSELLLYQLDNFYSILLRFFLYNFLFLGVTEHLQHQGVHADLQEGDDQVDRPGWLLFAALAGRLVVRL